MGRSGTQVRMLFFWTAAQRWVQAYEIQPSMIFLLTALRGLDSTSKGDPMISHLQVSGSSSTMSWPFAPRAAAMLCELKVPPTNYDSGIPISTDQRWAMGPISISGAWRLGA